MGPVDTFSEGMTGAVWGFLLMPVHPFSIGIFPKTIQRWLGVPPRWGSPSPVDPRTLPVHLGGILHAVGLASCGRNAATTDATHQDGLGDANATLVPRGNSGENHGKIIGKS